VAVAGWGVAVAGWQWCHSKEEVETFRMVPVRTCGCGCGGCSGCFGVSSQKKKKKNTS
jgi:hypothetical protein